MQIPIQMTPKEEEEAAARRRMRQGRAEMARALIPQRNPDLPKGPPKPYMPAANDGGGPIDVLSVMGAFPTWVAYRGHRQKAFLAQQGIRHGWHHVKYADDVAKVIEERGPRVVLNEVWWMDPKDVEALAKRFPETKFVALAHGTPAWVSTIRPDEHFANLRMAREIPNCYYGIVTNTGKLPSVPGTKVVEIPNFAILPGNLPEREDGPPTVSLIARSNEGIKHWGGSTMAVEFAARRIKDLHIVMATYDKSDSTSAHVRHFEEIGIPITVVQWGDWENYIRTVAAKVDAHLTASLSESLCLVPLEHCLLGRPAIAGPAVEWLPDAWKGNPQEPDTLAKRLAAVMQSRKASTLARNAAEAVVKRNHKVLIDHLGDLLG